MISDFESFRGRRELFVEGKLDYFEALHRMHLLIEQAQLSNYENLQGAVAKIDRIRFLLAQNAENLLLRKGDIQVYE